MMRAGLIALALVAASAAPAQDAAPNQPAGSMLAPDVTLRALDTLSGRVEDVRLRAGMTVTWERLEITVETCRVPIEAPDSDAFAHLVIRDIREEDPRFAGWMIASSPALSALDHPRYDVWVLSCSSS